MKTQASRLEPVEIDLQEILAKQATQIPGLNKSEHEQLYKVKKHLETGDILNDLFAKIYYNIEIGDLSYLVRKINEFDIESDFEIYCNKKVMKYRRVFEFDKSEEKDETLF